MSSNAMLSFLIMLKAIYGDDRYAGAPWSDYDATAYFHFASSAARVISAILLLKTIRDYSVGL